MPYTYDKITLEFFIKHDKGWTCVNFLTDQFDISADMSEAVRINIDFYNSIVEPAVVQGYDLKGRASKMAVTFGQSKKEARKSMKNFWKNFHG